MSSQGSELKTKNSQGVSVSRPSVNTGYRQAGQGGQKGRTVTNPSQEPQLCKRRQAARLALWGFAEYPSRLLCKNKALLR